MGYSLNIEMELAKFRIWRFDRLRLFHSTMVRRFAAILPSISLPAHGSRETKPQLLPIC
jgi:hypothetical protein